MKAELSIVLLIQFLSICCMSLQAFAAEKLTISELLDRCAANQNKLKSFVVRSRINENSLSESETTSHQKIVEFRYEDDGSDFRAYYCDEDVVSEKDGYLVLGDRHRSYLWDRKRYIEHKKAQTLDESYAFVSFNKEDMIDVITRSYYGSGSILHFMFGDIERFDSILRQADSISVRDDIEQLDSGSCYVIDAKTKHGTYTLWLDAEHSYSVAKAHVHKGPKDLRWGQPLDSFKPGPYDNKTFSIQNVRFENIEGLWIPVEEDFSIEFKGPNKKYNVDVHYKIMELTLNPDHDELKSFVPDIQDGTKVYIVEEPGKEYTWQERMKFVVDDWDGSIKYVPKDWSILVGVGKPLPSFEGIELDLSTEQAKDKAILVCFFDMQQRPSRHCIQQLAQRAVALKEKGITVAAAQTSKVAEKTLNEWIEKPNLPFLVEKITADIEKTRFIWGVRSLPWLILTDKEHIVTAEGFSLAELDEKISSDSEN